MQDKKLQELLDFATELIESAGEITLKYFRPPITVENKKGTDEFDPVTVADKEIESYIKGKNSWLVSATLDIRRGTSRT